MRPSAAVLLGWIALLAAGRVGGQVIRPPFGLEWGASPQQVLDSARQSGVKVLEHEETPGHTTFEVSISQQPFNRVDFGFQAGHLIQIVVRYPTSGNEGPGLVGSLRAEFQQGLGVGELLETGRQQNADGNEETRRVFRWQKEGCALWLILLEVRSEGRGRASEVTAVYANLGLSRRLEIDAAGR
ncbi:MAG TPA: hypothetical protein VGD78_18010 [Chthoniobacterales bacterium]